MPAYTGQVPDILDRPRDWLGKAACRTEDPEIFFDKASEHDARLVCVVRCPVRAACLANVKDAERGAARSARNGVIAGLGHNERWRLDPQARRGKDDPPPLELDGTEPCGTYPALLRHLWLGERVDPECWSAEVRRERGRRIVRDVAEATAAPTATEPSCAAPPSRGNTPHERRIYALWASGQSDLNIARRMAISVPAVKRVRDRLGLLPNLHVRAAS